MNSNLDPQKGNIVEAVIRHPLNFNSESFLENLSLDELRKLQVQLDDNFRHHLICWIIESCEQMGLPRPLRLDEFHLSTLACIKKELESFERKRSRSLMNQFKNKSTPKI